jgi:hypothetical protein
VPAIFAGSASVPVATKKPRALGCRSRPRFGRLNHVQADVFNLQNRTTGISEITLTGHAADMPKSTRMTLAV